MRRNSYLTLALLAGGFVSESTVAHAGLFCHQKRDCQEQAATCDCEKKCCKPKRHCCFCPPDAPDAEFGFAQAAVIRPGTAVRVDQSALSRATRQVIAQDAKKQTESASADDSTKSCDERLSNLEEKVATISSRIDRLTTIVEKLAEGR